MAELTVQPISPDGVDPLALLVAADVTGDSVKAANGLIIAVANADVGAHTVTFTAPAAEVSCPPYGKVALNNIVVSIPAGTERYITVPSGYALDGNFAWNYDAVTGVTVGVFVASPNS